MHLIEIGPFLKMNSNQYFETDLPHLLSKNVVTLPINYADSRNVLEFQLYILLRICVDQRQILHLKVQMLNMRDHLKVSMNHIDESLKIS